MFGDWPGNLVRPGYLARGDMRRFFASGTAIGIAVGCLGCAVMALGVVVELTGPHDHFTFFLGENIVALGLILFWSGFLWAIFRASMKNVRLDGLGIAFAVLFVVIVPPLELEQEFRGIVTWGVVCLAILMLALCIALKATKKEVDRLRSILHEERKWAGRDPVTGERLE